MKRTTARAVALRALRYLDNVGEEWNTTGMREMRLHFRQILLCLKAEKKAQVRKQTVVWHRGRI
jgi:hypothetical protein